MLEVWRGDFLKLWLFWLFGDLISDSWKRILRKKLLIYRYGHAAVITTVNLVEEVAKKTRVLYTLCIYQIPLASFKYQLVEVIAWQFLTMAGYLHGVVTVKDNLECLVVSLFQIFQSIFYSVFKNFYNWYVRYKSTIQVFLQVFFHVLGLDLVHFWSSLLFILFHNCLHFFAGVYHHCQKQFKYLVEHHIQSL